MNIILWAIPVIVMLLVLVQVLRQLPWMESGLKPRRVPESPGAARGAALRVAVSPECETPWFSGPGAAPGSGRQFDPLSRENLARICGKFHIREISLLPTKRAGRSRGQDTVGILVDFQPDASMDNSVIFRLRQELFQLVGRHVDLVCKNTVELESQLELIALARVLYAG